MKELILRTVTGISLVVLFIGSILLGPTPMLIMMLVVYGLGIRELFGLLSTPMKFPSILLAASGALLITGIWAGLNFHMNPLWLLLPTLMWIVGYAWHGSPNPGSLVHFWIAIPLALFIATGWFPGGSWSALFQYRSLHWSGSTIPSLT